MKKPRCDILLAGNPRWAKVLCDELAAEGSSACLHSGLRKSLRQLKPAAMWKFVSASVVHWVSGTTRQVPLFSLAKRRKKKVVLHWIGTDVVQLRDYLSLSKRLPAFYGELIDIHLADSPSLQQELQELGILSQVVRLLPQTVEAEVQPLPEQPAVLAYWSDESRAEFYGGSFILSLARNLPNIPFYIVGSGRGKMVDAPSNVTFLGDVSDMDEVYRKTTVFVRFIQHDSLSAMVLEALARGRYVLYSKPFPHTTMLLGLQDGLAALQKAFSATTPNTEGAEYVRENFSWRAEISKLKEIYGRLSGG